jgi:hypothetical protein
LWDICTIYFPYVVFDIPLAHTFPVHCHDFLFNFVRPYLTLFQHPRFEFAIPISRNNYLTFAVIADDCLRVITISTIAAFVAFWRVFFVAKVFIHLSFEHLFDSSGKQSLQLRLYVSRALAVLHQQTYEFHLLLC